MTKFSVFSVAAILACLIAVSVADFNTFQDEEGNVCPSCPTTKELLPVCGSNGRTYDNPGLFKCHNKCLKSKIVQKHYGPCREQNLLRKVRKTDDCPCVAPAIYAPVCGTNGKTYVSKYVLECEVKCYKTNIEVKHQGEC